jgi:putative DNA methylase
MLMDYAEANPFGDSSGSLSVIVDGIYRVLIGGSLIVPKNEQIVLRQRDAVAQVSDLTDFFVSMDPPYYDNVPYADLSDFFYVWQRRALNATWPDEYSTLLTPKLEELVADSVRFGDKSRAKSHFEQGMSKLFVVLRAKASETVPMTIFYAFQATKHESEGSVSTGWESFLTSLIDAGFTISATWPIRTENLSRARAQGSNALATSVVLVCRPRLIDAPMSTRGEVAVLIRAELAISLQILQSQNIAPVDLAQSAIGPGMSVFSRFSRVVESDGSNMSVRSALLLINTILSETLSGRES